MIRATPRDLVTTAGVALFCLVVSILSSGIVVGPVGPAIDPVVGLAVPLALLAGPPGIAGVVLGSAVIALVRWSFAWLTVVELLATGAMASVGYGLWGRLPVVSSGENPRLRTVRQGLEFVAVSVVAVVTGVAVLAWGTVLVRAQVFHGVALTELPIALASTLLVGSLVIGPAGWLFGESLMEYDRAPVTRDTAVFRATVLVPVVWVTVSSLVSIAARIVQSIGGNTLRQYGYGYVFVPFDPSVVGYGGRRGLVVFGAMMLALVVGTWLPRNQKRRERDSPTTSSSDS